MHFFVIFHNYPPLNLINKTIINKKSNFIISFKIQKNIFIRIKEFFENLDFIDYITMFSNCIYNFLHKKTYVKWKVHTKKMT